MLAVFPTGVGMNRVYRVVHLAIQGVPHGRGDEPWVKGMIFSRAGVFPTGVGMNRRPAMTEQQRERVPHGRGDEPGLRARLEAAGLCSPRAWG